MTTMQYEIRFSRYRDGDSRRSGPVWVNAENFARACVLAEGRLQGMIDADPESEFSIVLIELRGGRYMECSSGARIWETAEELSARYAAKEG